MEETTFTDYETNYSSRLIRYSIIIGVLLLVSLVSFLAIVVLSRSTNLILLIIPIVSFITFSLWLPSYLSSFSAFGPNQAVRLTNLGVYNTNLNQKEGEKFLAWEKIKQYDLKNANSKGLAETFFPKPTKFSLVGVYEEDSLTVEAFHEEAQTMTALLKEHNVPFGFVKN